MRRGLDQPAVRKTDRSGRPVDKKEEPCVKEERDILACIRGCGEAYAVCNQLGKEERGRVPDSLVAAFGQYLREYGETPEPSIPVDIEHMRPFLSALMELVLYYSGEESRRETISTIQENTTILERGEIRRILEIKRRRENAGGQKAGGSSA